MKIGTIKDLSMVDGEGVRLTLFTTGCSHCCDGCHNPDYQNYDVGYEMSIEEIMVYVKDRRYWIDGITLSGGDPLFQLNETQRLVYELKRDKETKHLSIWLYTGYLFEQIPDKILKWVDVIIDGKYDKNLEPIKWRGSSNQRLIRKIDGNWIETKE
jgi:anaerobic ribonucleoside-triphosphate reductase activating protein